MISLSCKFTLRLLQRQVKRTLYHSVIFSSNSEWSPVLAKNVRVAKYTRCARIRTTRVCFARSTRFTLAENGDNAVAVSFLFS